MEKTSRESRSQRTTGVPPTSTKTLPPRTPTPTSPPRSPGCSAPVPAGARTHRTSGISSVSAARACSVGLIVAVLVPRRRWLPDHGPDVALTRPPRAPVHPNPRTARPSPRADHVEPPPTPAALARERVAARGRRRLPRRPRRWRVGARRAQARRAGARPAAVGQDERRADPPRDGGLGRGRQRLARSPT